MYIIINRNDSPFGCTRFHADPTRPHPDQFEQILWKFTQLASSVFLLQIVKKNVVCAQVSGSCPCALPFAVLAFFVRPSRHDGSTVRSAGPGDSHGCAFGLHVHHAMQSWPKAPDPLSFQPGRCQNKRLQFLLCCSSTPLLEH